MFFISTPGKDTFQGILEGRRMMMMMMIIVITTTTTIIILMKEREGICNEKEIKNF